MPSGADVFHELKAVDAGQHDIQQYKVKPLPLQNICSRQPVVDALAVIARPAQAQADQLGNGLFILHN